MKRILLIMVLFTLLIVSCNGHKNMTDEATYWLQRCKAAEAVLEETLQNKEAENYFLDVVMEGDNYSIWYELGGNN